MNGEYKGGISATLSLSLPLYIQLKIFEFSTILMIKFLDFRSKSPYIQIIDRTEIGKMADLIALFVFTFPLWLGLAAAIYEDL